MPTSQPIFQVFDTTLTGITPDVFGVWETASAPDTSAVSFDITTAPRSAPSAAIPVWRATFPADMHEAETLLRVQQMRLEQVRQNVPRIVSRFDALTVPRSDGVSFEALPRYASLTGPEQELAGFLAGLQADESQVSFGLDVKGALGWKDWPDAVERMQAFLQQATRTISYAAWVETYREQLCLARTGVGWGGDTQTVWRRGVDAKHLPLHEHNLTLALTSRRELIAMVMFTVQTAVRLSALMNMPGNLIKILPAVWKCLQQLLEQSAPASTQ